MTEIEIYSDSINEWPIENVLPYDRSLKVRSHLKIRAIAHSIQNYGFDQAIVVDSEGIVIKGVGRLEAARFLKMDTVPVIQVHDLSAMEIIAARIADNKVAESEWDKDFLWSEVEDLINEGMEPKAFGFDARKLQEMFPEMTLDDFNPENDIPTGDNSNTTPLPNEPLTEEDTMGRQGLVLAHEGEDTWLNNLSMVEYLNLHETIIINLSAGKSSIATLFWCIDNGLKDKLYVLYGNVGWGVESPDTYRYIKYVENKVGIPFVYAGSSNPRHPGGFEDNIMQFGFPETNSDCWIETEIRNARLNSILKSEGFQKENSTPLSAGEPLSSEDSFLPNNSYVQIMGVRWESSPLYRTNFPERGLILGSTLHFASPLIKWKDLDVIKYLNSKGCKLHEMYLTQDKHSCFLCPKNHRATNIRFRKRYPKLWSQVLLYYAEGSRFTGILPTSICNWISDTEDTENYSGQYASQVTMHSDIMKEEVLDKKYRNSAHRLLEDALQGQPIYKSVTDQYAINVCN